MGCHILLCPLRAPACRLRDTRPDLVSRRWTASKPHSLRDAGAGSYSPQMSIRVEWDVPYPGETFPIGDLASFVQRVQALGAEPETEVLATAADNDNAIMVAFRVELDEASPNRRSSVICLERTEVADAVAVLEAIEDNEGDARLQLAAVRELRQRLTKLAMA